MLKPYDLFQSIAMEDTLKPTVGVLTFRAMFGPFAYRKMALLQFHLLASTSHLTSSGLIRKIDQFIDRRNDFLHPPLHGKGYFICPLTVHSAPCDPPLPGCFNLVLLI